MGDVPEGRTLLVLGAGASIGASLYPKHTSVQESMARMPSGENFFYDLFTMPANDCHGDRHLNMLGMTFEGLNRLIVRAWGLDQNSEFFEPDEWRGVNIEEVFTFLDIGQEMYNKGTSYQRAFAQNRESLERFITLMLSTKSHGMHCELLEHVVDALAPSDSIISFNWDTIADFTLQHARAPQFDAYLELMADRPRIRDFVDRGVLLKLHGSLNWLTCSSADCSRKGVATLAVDGRELLGLFDTKQKCPECGRSLGEPFIIPPTSRKLIRRGTPIHRLWMLAREQLGYVARIAFVGYSFPPTDFYSEWLFRQLYFVEEGRPEIIVVNPEVRRPGSPVEKRYQQLFRGCVMHKFATLEDFRWDGLELLKPA
jgi:hypothetical protein